MNILINNQICVYFNQNSEGITEEHCQLRNMMDTSARNFPSLNDFGMNKVVFQTGGTGLIGKCLVEKLLRTSEVREVIILVRPKRN